MKILCSDQLSSGNSHAVIGSLKGSQLARSSWDSNPAWWAKLSFLWKTPLQVWSSLVLFLSGGENVGTPVEKNKLPITTFLVWKTPNDSTMWGADRPNPWQSTHRAGCDSDRDYKKIRSKRERCSRLPVDFKFIVVYWLLKCLPCNSSLNVAFYKEVWFVSVLKATV